jgi:exonuclease-1
MGIGDLLVILRHLFKEKQLSDFKDKRIGIDGYCWLHKAVYCDNMDLAFNENSTGFIYFIKNKLNKMIKAGCIPVMIFDGDKLPIKNAEESEREYKRDIKRKEAYKLLEENRVEEAKLKMTTSIDINHEMVLKMVPMLEELDVEYIFAPYEGKYYLLLAPQRMHSWHI